MNQGQLFSPQRRWAVGDRVEVDGIVFWMEAGDHEILGGTHEVDIRMCHRDSEGRRRETKMELGFFVADFFTDNESAKNGHGAGRKGGGYYLDAMRQAARDGWEKAAERTSYERERKRGTP